MFIDARSRLILEELAICQGRMPISRLMKKYEWNARQIDYSIAKINDYLSFQQMDKIIKINGELISDSDVLTILSKVKKYSKKIYILSEEERTEISLLLLIAQKEPLSLQDFIIDLDISKNTALKNMKNVKQMLSEYQLTLTYSRNDGYQIQGKETTIRSLLRDITINLVADEIKTDYVLSLLKIEAELQLVRDKLALLEQQLAIVYTDHRHSIVSLLITIFLRRIQQGKVIKGKIPDQADVQDTQEYQVMQSMFGNSLLSTNEIVYLTIYILAIDISKVEDSLKTGVPTLRPAIDQLINLFEKQACITFFDRTLLIKMLIQHLKPAYYRVKYRLNLSQGLNETLIQQVATDKEFKEIYQIIRTCIKPIEQVFGQSLPETELRLLTLIFASEMKNERNEQKEQYRAAVVCSEGISVSRILYLTLSELIPELQFLQPMSLRELATLDSSAYDLVIAPFYVETNKKLIIIDPVITQRNRNRVRENILSQLYGISSNQLSVERIMDIIREHTNIADEQQLISNLTSYIYVHAVPPKQKIALGTDESNPSLAELLPKERIVKVKEVSDWKEALYLAAVPLIQDGSIMPEYIEKIIENYTKEIPHIVFGKEIAVPHANEANFVYKLGMSMLIIENGVTFTQNQHVHIVILLATPDKQSHLTAMLQLLELSTDEQAIEAIQKNEATTVLELLKIYC